MLYEPLVRVTTPPPAFLKRKPAGNLGFQGGFPLGASLHPFSARRKDVAAQGDILLVGWRFLCADIPPQRSGLRATPFLYGKKGGKEPSGGFPP